MNKFVLHPEAFADLDEIWEYIAADNLDAADRVVEEIYEAIGALVRFPHQGHPPPISPRVRCVSMSSATTCWPTRPMKSR